MRKTLLLILLTAVLCGCNRCGCNRHAVDATSNAIFVIEPYRYAGTWVFDDARVGLRAEPFVAGVPELIDRIVADAGIPSAEKGFRLLFSAQPFPGYQTKFVRRGEEAGGHWYYSEKYGAEGWLCPAMFKYFKQPPKELYAKAEAIKAKRRDQFETVPPRR